MEHIRQRENECFPTTLAMLAGKDVNKILAEAQAMSPTIHNWSMFTSTAGDPKYDDTVTLTYRALARKYAPYLIDYVDPVSVHEIARDKRYIGFNEFMRRTAEGKGAILSCSRYFNRPLAHICAFENGMIYDSDLEAPMQAKDYYTFLAKKTILCPYAIRREDDL